jgi:hypothetical protein
MAGAVGRLNVPRFGASRVVASRIASIGKVWPNAIHEFSSVVFEVALGYAKCGCPKVGFTVDLNKPFPT